MDTIPIVSSISNNSHIDSQLSHQSSHSSPPQLPTNATNPQQTKPSSQSESNMSDLELPQPLNDNTTTNQEEPQLDHTPSSHSPLEPIHTQKSFPSQISEPVSGHFGRQETEENCAEVPQDTEANDNKNDFDSQNFPFLRFTSERAVPNEKTGDDMPETPKMFTVDSLCPQKSEASESKNSLLRGQDQQSEKNEYEKENYENSQQYSFGGEPNDDREDRAQYFEDQNPARFELLHSDSNFMFGPRFKTRPCDPTTSPIKRSHKKGKDRGQKFFVEDENSQQYNNEEADRKKSLSRLGASNNKKSKTQDDLEDMEEERNMSQDTCPLRDMSQNDAYLSSQNDDSNRRTFMDDNKGSRRLLLRSDSFGSNYQEFNNNNGSNWSTLNEQGGDNTATANHNMMEMNPGRQGQDMNESQTERSNSKYSHKSSKRFGDSENKSLQKINEELDLSYSSHQDNSAQKSHKSAINGGSELNLEVETRRSSDKDKNDYGLASPIHQVMPSTKMIEEEPVEDSNMMIEDIEHSQESRVGLDVKKSSPKASDATGESLETTAVENGSQETVNQFEPEFLNGKKLSFMERKLLRLQQETLKSMGDLDFKKVYSKLEKEKMESKQKENDDENVALPCPKNKLTMLQSGESSFMSDTKKHYSKLQLEKLKLKSEEKSGEMMTPTIKNSFAAAMVGSITRPPLQMIQSEAERDMREMQTIQDMSVQKSLVFTPQAGQKKRKYDAIEGEESAYKMEQMSNLKKVKMNDENQVESLEAMLAKSVKKMSKIEMEKLQSKEKEKLEREQELKELSHSMKDAVFKVEVPLSLGNSNTSSSEKREEQGKLSSKRNSLTGMSKNCALCGNSFGLENHAKEMTCSHKAHMECYNKMVSNKKDCTTCASEKVSKNYLQR